MNTGIINYAQPLNLSHPLNRGKIACYRALPSWNSGLQWRDLCQRSNAPFTGSPTWASSRGRPGGVGSLEFDNAGAGSWVDCGNLAIGGFDFVTAAVSVYVRTAGGGGFGRIFSKNDGDPLVALVTSTTAVSVTINSVGLDGTLVDAAWNRVLVTYNRSINVGALYVNGLLADSDTVVGAVASNANSFLIGNRESDSRQFDGWIDLVEVWADRAFDAGEAYQDFQLAMQQAPATYNYIPVPIAWNTAAAATTVKNRFIGGGFIGAGCF